MAKRKCSSCGREIEKGYFIVDEFSGSAGLLCEKCFDYMCFNRIVKKLVTKITITTGELKVEYALKEEPK